MARPPRPGVHQALLDAARDEFARRGLARARVEDVTRRAGVSKGAFYLHFRSKEEAFQQIAQRFIGALDEQADRRRVAEERFAAEHAGGRGRPLHEARLELEVAQDAEVLEVLWKNRTILGALDTAATSHFARLLVDVRRRMRDLVGTRVADQQAAGRLRRDVEPGVIGDLLVGTYEGFARRMIEMPARPDLAGWARSLLMVLYEGLLARGDGPVPAPGRGPRAGRRAPGASSARGSGRGRLSSVRRVDGREQRSRR